MRWRTISKADGIVSVLCVAMLFFVLGAVDQVGKEEARRRVCKTRLSGLGKAMLLYCNDYDDEFLKAGGRANEWVPTIPNWQAQTRRAAFDINGRQGKVTVTSSLYLLVKYLEVTPKQFVCPSDPETREFKLETVPDELPKDFRLYDAWDFGGRYDESNNPASHCSYAYHMPFNNYALTTTHEPGMAVLADRNPWMNPKRVTDPNLGWEPFINGGADTIPNGNSDTHQRQGQNVLFLDSHVAFETRATCGVEKDNIYAIGAKKNSPEMPKTQCPKVYGKARPANRHDSVLVQGI